MVRQLDSSIAACALRQFLDAALGYFVLFLSLRCFVSFASISSEQTVYFQCISYTVPPALLPAGCNWFPAFSAISPIVLSFLERYCR